MPYKAKKTKKVGKLTKVRKPKNSIFGGMHSYRVKPEPFPRVMYTRTKFAQQFSMTTNGLGSAVARTFRVNSIWDPDLTGIGNTVAGHAALASIYGRYIVTNCKMTIRFFDPGADQIKVGCRLRIGTASATAGRTVNQLMEQPLTYLKGLANSGSQTSVYNFNIKPWTLIGLSKLEYFAGMTIYSSIMAGSPAVLGGYVDIFIVDTTGAAIPVTVLVKMEYECQFYERKHLPSSGIV